MLLNKDLSLTSSLQIVQPQQRIHFSRDSCPSDNSHLQELDYSHDQQSLSFQIEDERIDRSETKERSRSKEKQKLRVVQEDSGLDCDSKRNCQQKKGKESILSNQPPKRKRKQIFDKYKVAVVEEIDKQQPSMTSIQNDILRTFDEIFSLGTPRNQKSQQNSLDSPIKNFSKKLANHYESEQVRIPVTSQKEFNITKTPQTGICMLKKQNNSTYGNFEIPQKNRNENINASPITNLKMNIKTHENNKGNEKNLMQSSSFFKTPFDLVKEKHQEQVNQKNEIFNLSNIQYRISYIEGKQEIQYSRDSSDFAEILGAQIFNEKPKSRILDHVQKGSLKEIKQEQTIVSPEMQIKHQIQNPNSSPQKSLKSPSQQSHTLTNFQNTSSSKSFQNQFKPLNQISEQNMGESRFSDVYQRIDMSHSITSSVMIKNQKYQCHENHGNFFGLNQNKSVIKSFAKSGSLGLIGFAAQDETMINALASQIIIEEARQELKFPIFLRKASKFNSTFPNFNHPSIGLNFDKENQLLQELVGNFLDSVCFLEKMFETIKIREYKKKQIKFLFESGINLQKFLSCNFVEFNKIQGLQRLKPKQNFVAKQWHEGKVWKALENYHRIINGHLGIKINLEDERGIAKYCEIRKKYWQIERNMILIAQDMYSYLVSQGFAQHIIEMKNILNQKEIFFNQGQIRMKKIFIEKLRCLRNNGDDFCLSEVGLAVIHKLQEQMKYNSTNF